MAIQSLRRFIRMQSLFLNDGTSLAMHFSRFLVGHKTMGINFDKALGIHEQALLIQSKRTAVLANNIANADTPGYKAKDIDFAQMLNDAARGLKSTSAGITKTHPQHFASDARFLNPETKFRIPLQPDTGDGNTVDANIEQAEFTQSAMQYQASLTFLGGKLRSLLTAIRGE